MIEKQVTCIVQERQLRFYVHVARHLAEDPAHWIMSCWDLRGWPMPRGHLIKFLKNHHLYRISNILMKTSSVPPHSTVKTCTWCSQWRRKLQPKRWLYRLDVSQAQNESGDERRYALHSVRPKLSFSFLPRHIPLRFTVFI